MLPLLTSAGRTGITDTSRKMYFQRVTVKPSEELLEVNLVINLPPGFSQDGEVTLYETSDDDSEHRKELDKASVPSCHSTCWFELTIGVDNLQDNMVLLVEFTHRNREFVQGLNPMIALYTYMEQPLSTIVARRHAPDSMTAHHEDHEGRRDDHSEQEEANHDFTNVLLSELNGRNHACSKQTVTLAYSQMNWLGSAEDITLINPTHIRFKFCHGHCNIPVDTVPYDDEDESFDKRARILEVMNRLSESRLTPPPCCVPHSYVANEVIYLVGDRVAMTTFPSVEECGCKA